MAQKRLAIPSDEIKMKLVGAFDELDVPRVQRVTMNADIASTDIYELGNNTLAGTTSDIPNITLTFSAFDTGIKTTAVLAGEDPAAYPVAGINVAALSEVDAVLEIKSSTISDIIKSIHGRRLQVQNFSFSYSVDAESAEDYTMAGSEKRLFKNDIIVDKFDSGTTSFTLTQTPIQLKNGNYVLSAILDGEYLTEVAVAPDEVGEYRVVGTTLTTYDTLVSQLIVIYHADPAGTNWDYIDDDDMPAAIRGKDVKVVIAANDISRVQSVTINGNLNVQVVREMGNDAIVGYQKQVPTVDGSITVLDTDTELLDLLLNGSLNSGDTEFQIGTECVASGVSLEVQLYDPCDNTLLLKTVYIPQLVLTGDSYASSVNQNATYTLNWKSNTAECIIYSGARP